MESSIQNNLVKVNTHYIRQLLRIPGHVTIDHLVAGKGHRVDRRPSLAENINSHGDSAVLQDAGMARHAALLCAEEEHAGSRSEGSIGNERMGGAVQLWRGFQRLRAAEARQGLEKGAHRSHDLVARSDSREVAGRSGLDGGGGDCMEHLESRSMLPERERTPPGGVVRCGEQRGGHVSAGRRVCLRASYWFVAIFVLSVLQLSEASFTVRTVSQSTPLPDALNTLTFSLVSSAALRGENASAITIAGLRGAIVDSGSLQLLGAPGGTGLFCHNGAPGVAGWDADSQSLTLAMCGDATMEANVTYAFAAVVRNPAAAQAQTPNLNP